MHKETRAILVNLDHEETLEVVDQLVLLGHQVQMGSLVSVASQVLLAI